MQRPLLRGFCLKTSVETPDKDVFFYILVRLQRLGLDKRLDELHVVHVAGTKGKVLPSSLPSRPVSSHMCHEVLPISCTSMHCQGSTCAMVESILRCCGYNTGLFTSPHLWDVRERIQLDG